MKRVRIAGVALALTAAGCFADPGGLRDMMQASLPDLIDAPQTPRLARMQQEFQASPAVAPPPGTQPVSYRPGDPRGNPDPAREVLRVNIRARVNGKPIFDDEILSAILPDLYRIRKEFGEPQRSEKETELFNAALDKFIEEEVVYQDAFSKLKKNNPKALETLKQIAKKEFDKKMATIKDKRNWTDADLLEQLKREGLTLETWERKEEKDFIIREYLRNRIFPEIQKRVTHADIREYYEQHQNEFMQVDKVKWQNIFIAVGPRHPTLDEARRTAEALIERWRAGDDFMGLLAFNDGPNRTGDGYGSRKGEIKPAELEEYLFAMNEGDIGPAVRLPSGVHIFRVSKRDYAGPVPFDEEVQKTIRRKLSNDVAAREEKRIIGELKARAVIEISP